MALLWGTQNADNSFTKGNGGHFVTLQQISWNTRTDTGTISFIDPGSAAYVQTATLTEISGGTYNGDLYVTYPNPAVAAVDGDNGENEAFSGGWDDGAAVTPSKGGIIINDLAEAVPDGGLTAMMLGSSLLGLAALRRRYC